MFFKVRKCSQESVAAIINCNPGDTEFHPACQATTKFCIQELEKYKGMVQIVKKLVFKFYLQYLKHTQKIFITSALKCCKQGGSVFKVHFQMIGKLAN